MTDGQDIFESEVPEGETPEVAPTRDEQGRFAPKDTGEAADVIDPAQGEPPAPAEKQSHMVPLATVLDDREKRQRAEASARQAEARIATLERQLAAMQSPQEPQRLPDPVEDAEGYTRALAGQFEQRMRAQVLTQSRFFAERDFGKDLVAEAMSFFDNQPRAVSEQFLSAPSPFHAAMEWYKGQKLAEERGSPDYEANLREKLRAEIMAEMQAKAPVAPRLNPPRPLAEAPGSSRAPAAGGHPLFD